MDSTLTVDGLDEGRPVQGELADGMVGRLEHESRVLSTHARGGKAVPHRVTLPQRQVAWVRASDLISSGTGRIAGRGMDFEAELARRLRHPTEVTRRAIQNRRSSLPPLSAFGLRQPSPTSESLSRR